MRFLLALLLLIAFPWLATAADPWSGKVVFVKQYKIIKPGETVVNGKAVYFPTTVDEVRDDLLKLGETWVLRTDVMLAQQAVEFYSQRIKREPQTAAWWINRARAAHELSKFDDAIKDYTEAIRLDPQEVIAYHNRGAAYQSKRDLKSALQDYSEAIRVQPKFAMAYFMRGKLLVEQGNLESAIADFSELIRLEPKLSMGYEHRGTALQNKGDLESALQDYSQVILLQPNSAWGYLSRGIIRQQEGDLDSAINDFSEAIRLDDKSALAYNDLAWIRATAFEEKYRNGTEAIKLASKACELTTWNNWGYLDTLAAAFAEAGNFSSAANLEEKALRLAPADKKKTASERLALYQNKQPYRQTPKK